MQHTSFHVMHICVYFAVHQTYRISYVYSIQFNSLFQTQHYGGYINWSIVNTCKNKCEQYASNSMNTTILTIIKVMVYIQQLVPMLPYGRGKSEITLS